MTILSAAMLLFLILDPLGNVPVFLSVLKPLPPRRQRIVVVRELLIALAVLIGRQFPEDGHGDGRHGVELGAQTGGGFAVGG